LDWVICAQRDSSLIFVSRALVFDLFSWRRPLTVTIIGGLIFVAANAIMDAVAHSSYGQQLTVWAQHHP
jgi:hypothetical protein